MKAKFPTLWAERMGSSSYDHNGNLTSKAQLWAHELALLTPEMVKVGLRDLSHLPNPAFPPSAIQFVKHCRDRYFFTVQTEVMTYINRPYRKGLQWSGLVAYNVYENLYHSPNESQEQLRARIEKVYNSLSWHDLKPIPKTYENVIEHKDRHPINDEPGYMKFCGAIAALLSANTKPGENYFIARGKKLEAVFPDLTREWWPEFKSSGMDVGQWLREVKELNLPINPKFKNPVEEMARF